MLENSILHPCFNKKVAGKHARIHLPLIKSCNIQCNYCNRKYSCPNENRPGVTSQLIKPEDINKILKNSLKKYENLNIVGIAGPGEALAEPKILSKAFKIIRKNFPDLKLCLSTNGFMLTESINLIQEFKVDFITVTINTLNYETASKIYNIKTPETLIKKQIEGIKALSELNIVTKINTVVIPDINFKDAVEIAKFAGESKLFAQNIMPFYPVEGSVFENLPEPSIEDIEKLRQECSKHIKQISHCKRCRADAEGYLE